MLRCVYPPHICVIGSLLSVNDCFLNLIVFCLLVRQASLLQRSQIDILDNVVWINSCQINQTSWTQGLDLQKHAKQNPFIFEYPSPWWLVDNDRVFIFGAAEQFIKAEAYDAAGSQFSAVEISLESNIEPFILWFSALLCRSLWAVRCAAETVW